jgi:GDP-mannose 6-dehydrogenase
MNITVMGLGYVGTVMAASWANKGHFVWGVDINPDKTRMINEGRSPIIEPGLGEHIRDSRLSNRLSATTNVAEALVETEICFLAVATPSRPNGQIDPTHLIRACTEIAQCLSRLNKRQIVVIRSSLLPSSYDRCRDIFGSKAPGLVELCANPEFLREGSALRDFEQPPFTVVGTDSRSAADTLRALYADVQAPVVLLRPAEALMVKYASNCYHALKVSFANEIATICRHVGAEPQTVLEVFCQDTTLNISDRYLQPGFAFGGSCLPKDLRALIYAASEFDLQLPLVRAILPSNEEVIDRAFQGIRALSPRKIGLIGLSFKANTDDLRESPYVELAERLLGKGYDLRIYDPNVMITSLTGKNKQYIDNLIPHLSRLLVADASDLAGSDLLLVGHHYKGLEELFQRTTAEILHLSGVPVEAIREATAMSA